MPFSSDRLTNCMKSCNIFRFYLNPNFNMWDNFFLSHMWTGCYLFLSKIFHHILKYWTHNITNVVLKAVSYSISEHYNETHYILYIKKKDWKVEWTCSSYSWSKLHSSLSYTLLLHITFSLTQFFISIGSLLLFSFCSI